MSIIVPWLNPDVLDREPDGDIVVTYTARLLFTLLEESKFMIMCAFSCVYIHDNTDIVLLGGSIAKFLEVDGLSTIIPLAQKLLAMEDPRDNPATSTVLDILQVLTALSGKFLFNIDRYTNV
jgi:hypothetical protein